MGYSDLGAAGRATPVASPEKLSAFAVVGLGGTSTQARLMSDRCGQVWRCRTAAFGPGWIF